MAYATGDEFVTRFDVRTLGDLLSDDDTRVDPIAVPTDDRLLASLDDASAMIDEALAASNKYDRASLEDISTAGSPALIRMTCELALGLLFEGRSQVPSQAQSTIIDKAHERLDKLRMGLWVIPTHPNETAQMKPVIMSTAQRQRLGLMSDSSHFHERPWASR